MKTYSESRILKKIGNMFSVFLSSYRYLHSWKFERTGKSGRNTRLMARVQTIFSFSSDYELEVFVRYTHALICLQISSILKSKRLMTSLVFSGILLSIKFVENRRHYILANGDSVKSCSANQLKKKKNVYRAPNEL